MLEFAAILIILAAATYAALKIARPYGWVVLAVALIALVDVGARSLLEETPLFVNATYSQPALRVHGAIVGVSVFLLLAVVAWRTVRRTRTLALDPLDKAVAALVPLALVGAGLGLARGHKLVFVLGDTYKVLIVVAAYALVRLMAASRVDYERVFVAVAAVAACAGAIQLVKIASRLFEGTTLNSVGTPPIAALALALAVLAFGRWGDQRRGLVLTMGVGVLLMINFLSLVRGLWIVSLVLVLLAVAMAPRRMLGRAVLPGVALYGAIFVLVVVSPSAVGSELRYRIDELAGSGDVASTLVPPDDPVDSVDERLWEARDATAELSSGGPLAYAVGRGAGAEYPTPLERFENTSSEGYRHHIHITWVSVLYRNGVVGLAVLCAIIGIAIAGIATAFRRERSAPARTRVVRAGVLLWLTGSALSLTYAYGFFGEVSWGIVLAAACGMAVSREARVAA